jgi:hypothetical protein
VPDGSKTEIVQTRPTRLVTFSSLAVTSPEGVVGQGVRSAQVLGPLRQDRLHQRPHTLAKIAAIGHNELIPSNRPGAGSVAARSETSGGAKKGTYVSSGGYVSPQNWDFLVARAAEEGAPRNLPY